MKLLTSTYNKMENKLWHTIVTYLFVSVSQTTLTRSPLSIIPCLPFCHSQRDQCQATESTAVQAAFQPRPSDQGSLTLSCGASYPFIKELVPYPYSFGIYSVTRLQGGSLLLNGKILNIRNPKWHLERLEICRKNEFLLIDDWGEKQRRICRCRLRERERGEGGTGAIRQSERQIEKYIDGWK